jgi:hypothetical protein
MELKITNAFLESDKIAVYLNDGRIVIYPLTGMSWITEATFEQQQDFVVTDWEIYWNQIDDGLTLEHILSPKPRVDFTIEKHPNWDAFRKLLENVNIPERNALWQEVDSKYEEVMA